MKSKIYLATIISCLLFSLVQETQAQTILYNETFDADSVNLPAGWAATANGWKISTSNNSSGYTGSSGLYNADISNATGLSGTFTLTSKSISTAGYSNIAVLWAARNTTHFSDSGSRVQSFNYSIDGGSTWNNLAYTENGNNSVWSLDNGGYPIVLPAAADNQASVMFQWTVVLQSTSSGTYRIDDFSVAGTGIGVNGIIEYSEQDVFKIFVDENKSLHLMARPSYKLPTDSYLTITDVSGRICANDRITANTSVFSLASLKTGIYFVKVSSGDLLFVQKIVVY